MRPVWHISMVLLGMSFIPQAQLRLAGASVSSDRETRREKAALEEKQGGASAAAPLDAAEYFERGRAKRLRGDLVGARADYDRAIRLQVNDANLRHHRARLRSDLGDWAGALTDYDQVIVLEPGRAEVYFERGLLRKAREDFPAALEDFEQFVEREPQRPEGWFARGQLRQLLGDFAGAAADYDRHLALITSPESTAYLYRTICLMRMGRVGGNEPLIAALEIWPEGWSKDLAQYLMGSMTAEQLQERAWRGNFSSSFEQQSDAHYFIGIGRLVSGDKIAAAQAFADCVALGLVARASYAFAKSELQRLSP